MITRTRAINLACALGGVATIIIARPVLAQVDPSAANAPVVTLGDGTVSAARLTPYDNAFVVTHVRSDGVRENTGIWTDQLQLRHVDGREVFVRTQGFAYYTGHAIFSVNVFDPKTFAPISDNMVNPDGSAEQWKIDGLTATGQVRGPEPGAKAVARTVRMSEPAYDLNCCMRSLLPAAMRLRVGQSVVVPTIAMAEDDPKAISYRVIGREKVHAGYRGLVEATIFETPGPGGGEIRFWIIDTAPFLVRMTLIGIPGSRTRAGVHIDQYFDMIG